MKKKLDDLIYDLNQIIHIAQAIADGDKRVQKGLIDYKTEWEENRYNAATELVKLILE